MQQTINRMEVECYSKKTISSYKKYCNEFVCFSLGELSQENINPYLTYLVEKSGQPSTVNVARSALFYFFNKVLKQPITIEIYKPKRKMSEPNPISREDIKAMIESENNIEKRVCLELLYSTGMRRFEVCKAKWQHIDWNLARMKVIEGKGKKDGYVPLSQAVMQHLRDIERFRINSYIFPNKNHPELDWHISESTPLRWVKEAAEKAGITSNVYTHRFRASFITHLIENGYPEKYVQKLARHNSRQTTDRYEKVADYRLAQVRSPLDDLDKGIEIEKRLMDKCIVKMHDAL